MNLKAILYIFIGGGVGSVLRYLISKYFNVYDTSIPYGTLIANVTGCFLIGIFIGFMMKSNYLSQNFALLLITGFCGGFTTFSTFALENHNLLKSGDITSFLIYTFGSIVIGLIFVFLGLFIANKL